MAQDKDQWRTLLSMIINLLVPFKAVDLVPKRLLRCPGHGPTNCQRVQEPPSKSGRHKVHNKDLQILGAKAQHLVARATWRLGFTHPSTRIPVIGLALLNYDTDRERSVVTVAVQGWWKM